MIKNWKTKPLTGWSLLYTAIILAGNRTQVTFSGIIPQDHQDLRRYCQYSFQLQISDCPYRIYENLLLHNKWVILVIKRQHIYTYIYTKFYSACVLGSIQVVHTTKNLKHLNLKKWHKFNKRSQILLRFEYTINQVLKANGTPSAVWTGKLSKLEQIDGTYKDELWKYFNAKTKDTCHIPFQSII